MADGAIDPSASAVALKLRELEHYLDAALAARGELEAALVRGRFAHRLSATVGHQAFAAFGQAGLSLTEARGSIVKGHRLLDGLRRSLNIVADDGDNFGDERKDPSDPATWS